MLTQLQNSPKVVGAKQTKRAIGDGRARRVFLAEDADPRITAGIAELSAASGVEIEWVSAMRDLGQACGIAVGAAVAALIS